MLLLDRGFYDFEWWAQLIAKQAHFICAAKSTLDFTVIEDFSLIYGLKDRLVEIGKDKQGLPLVRLRLIELRKGQGWYRYLTSVLEPDVLPPLIDLNIPCWQSVQDFSAPPRHRRIRDRGD